MIKSDRYKGHIYVLISAIGFSLVPLLAKFSLDSGMNAETMLTYRFIIAGIFFMIYISRKKISLRTDRKTCIKLLSIGLLYALESMCFFEAFKHISPSIGQLLFQVNPIMVAIAAFFVFKDKLTKNVILALMCTCVGCVLLFWESAAYITTLGIVLVLLAALFYTTYIILGKEMLKDIPPMIVTTYTTFGCAGSLLIYSVLTNKLMVVDSMSIALVIIVLSVFSTIISILFFAVGLKILGATKAAILSAIEPVVTVGLDYAIFGEKLFSIQMVGGILIVLSIIVIELKFDSKNKKIKLSD